MVAPQQVRTPALTGGSTSPQLWAEWRQHPELLSGSDRELVRGLVEGNYRLPNTSTLLEQLDTIDNAACGWTRFMSKVGPLKGCGPGST